jgi:hypothetical protein
MDEELAIALAGSRNPKLPLAETVMNNVKKRA